MIKKLLLILLFTFVTLPVMASELSQKALQGSWLIVELAGEKDDEGDMWEFEGNKFYQNISGRRISPDEFTTSPGVIDLGYAKISVESFDGTNMIAKMAGFKYKLIKQ